MSPFSPVLWAFLPGQISQLLIPFLSSALPGFFPSAPKGSPGYQRNYKWAYTIVVVSYLVYTFASSTIGAQGLEDWYAVLGVSVDVDDEGLKKAFRALQYHPDRSPNSGEIFIYLRKAYEGLSDPITRFAYDRFGPDAVEWKAATYREYMRQGIMQSAGFYMTSAGIMLFLKMIGRAREGQYWRNTLFACLFIAESSLLLASGPLASRSPILGHLVPVVPVLSQPAFLQIRFLHRAFTSLSIGLTQLAGVWTSRPSEERIMAEIQTLVHSLHLEAGGAFKETVVPLLSRGNPLQVEKLLMSGMEQALIDRAVSTHPQIRPFWQEAISRARDTKRPRQQYPTDAGTGVEPEALYPMGYAPPPYSTSAGTSQSARFPEKASLVHARKPGQPTGRAGAAWDLGQVEEELRVASGVPLPDSPPGSPVIGARQL